MRWVSREHGVWELCRTRVGWVRGTTPRNAGTWTLDVDLGRRLTWPSVWLITGRHWGVTLWLNGDRSLQVHRRPPTAGRRRCACWGCTGAARELSRARAGWDVAWDRGPLPVVDEEVSE